MSKRILISLLIMATTSLVTSCNAESSKISFDEVLNNINSNNEKFRVPEVNLKDYINEVPMADLFNIEEIERLVESEYTNKGSISKEEAIEDLDFFFKLLKNNYGLYTYLGGDSKFLKAKKEIINKIDMDTISTEDFCNIIVENLDFVNDNHFRIRNNLSNEKVLGDKSFYYILDKEYYYKDKKGFFINNGKDKRYITSINDDVEVEKYMNLSIGDNGELVYKLGTLLTPDNDEENLRGRASVDINVNYKVKGKDITEKKTLIRTNYLLNTGDVFSIKVDNNIPILSLRSFSLDDEIRNDFLESAIELKNYNINILDLRGNAGGDGTLVVEWLEKRFGFRPVGNSKKIGLNRFFHEEDIYSDEDMKRVEYLFNLEFKDYYYYSKDLDEETLYDTDSLIFILMDINQGSAGEMFVEYMKNYKNVILIGTNTSGTIEGSNQGIDFKLPNSEIRFMFGQWLYLYDKEYFKESVGYKPDILVNGNDALGKTLELIEYYKLN